MTRTDMRLFALLAPFLLFGCYESRLPGGDRCAAEQVCFTTDALGCCAPGGTRVSVCDACPAGTSPRTACRTTGCEPPCAEAPVCRMDMGSGCCGDFVFSDSCESCPAGSVDASRCTADSPGECGCGDMLGPIIPPGEPESPPSEPPADRRGFFCYSDLGGGCCGDTVGTEDSLCGCPAGTIPEESCVFPGDGFFPGPRCNQDLGGGCCGDLVDPNGCGFCPPGSIPTEECGAHLDGDSADPAPEPPGGGPEEPGAPAPPDTPPCRVDLGEGRCGCYVFDSLNACGQCPPGATMACDTVNCLMP